MALSRQTVREILEQKGFTCSNLDEYKSLDTVLHIKCCKGHEIEAPLRLVRDDRFKCLVCEGQASTATLIDHSDIPPKNGKRVVAIDNATKDIGIAVYDNGKLSYYRALHLEGEIFSRMVANRNFLENVIIAKWKPDLIIVEDIQEQNNLALFKKLSMLLGSTIVSIKKSGIPYHLVGNTVWRSHFMIKGTRENEKLQAMNKVQQMFGMLVTDDVAEAILIGKYAVDALDKPKPKKLF